MRYAATSQLFLQAPKFDDQFPYSSDGGILDIHITAFQSAIDSLLTIGRSNSPTRVLQPMKSVVNAVTAIVDDVRAYERRIPRDQVDSDVEFLQGLRERAEATLSNLAVAAKTHATSSGMSPVSLLDAAASHVSVTITEMGKAVQIRKATKAEQEKFAMTQYSPTATGGFTTSLRSVDETKAAHQRSTPSTSLGKGRYHDSIGSPPSRSVDPRRPQSDSSEQTNSPPPIFDQQNFASDDSGQAEGPEDNWAELTVSILSQIKQQLMVGLAVPRRPNWSDGCCDSKCPHRRSKRNTVTDIERESDADHNHRVKYRSCLQGQFTSKISSARE
jgi:hypothetical protein